MHSVLDRRSKFVSGTCTISLFFAPGIKHSRNPEAAFWVSAKRLGSFQLTLMFYGLIQCRDTFCGTKKAQRIHRRS